MPAYDFRCIECEEITTTIMTMTEYQDLVAEDGESHVTCEHCGGWARRKFSPAARRWKHKDERLIGKDLTEM